MAIYTLLTCGDIETVIASNDYYFTVSSNGKPVGQIVRPYWHIGDKNAPDWRMWQASTIESGQICPDGYMTAKSALRAVYRAMHGMQHYPPVKAQSYEIE